MSILERIKIWSFDFRAWLVEPVLIQANMNREQLSDKLFVMQSGLIEQKRLSDELDTLLKYRFNALDAHANQLEILFDGRTKTLQGENVAILEQVHKLTEELNGIRSRYKWIEDRYEDVTKGNVPRTFDHYTRQ